MERRREKSATECGKYRTARRINENNMNEHAAAMQRERGGSVFYLLRTFAVTTFESQ